MSRPALGRAVHYGTRYTALQPGSERSIRYIVAYAIRKQTIKLKKCTPGAAPDAERWDSEQGCDGFAQVSGPGIKKAGSAARPFLLVIPRYQITYSLPHRFALRGSMGFVSPLSLLALVGLPRHIRLIRHDSYWP